MPTPKLDPYLIYDGNCSEAFHFYERVLGAKISMISTYASSPMGASMPASHANRILHARLLLDGQAILASDAPPGRPYGGIKGCALSLNYPTRAAATTAFHALAEGGQIDMAIDKTFWADAFGMLTDRFGVAWMVGCEKE